MISSKKLRRVTFLGLSFKAGTDDLRNSPTVDLVEKLIGKGYDIKIFDENVSISRLHGVNKDFIENAVPHISKIFYDDINEAVAGSEILIIATKSKIHYDTIKNETEKIIIDLVRLDEELLQNENYTGICW